MLLFNIFLIVFGLLLGLLILLWLLKCLMYILAGTAIATWTVFAIVEKVVGKIIQLAKGQSNRERLIQQQVKQRLKAAVKQEKIAARQSRLDQAAAAKEMERRKIEAEISAKVAAKQAAAKGGGRLAP
jgi:hypothetical protein